MKGNCTNRCFSHARPPGPTRDQYANGCRYCSTCRIYIKTPAKFCYCCSRRLRLGPRIKVRAASRRSEAVIFTTV